jgi:hypothetical protein
VLDLKGFRTEQRAANWRPSKSHTTKGNGLQTVTLAFKVYESLASQTFGRRDFALILKLKSLRFDALNEVALMITCVQFQIVVCFRPFLTHTINIENGIRR